MSYLRSGLHILMAILLVVALTGCQEHGTEERLRAAADVIGAEYKITSDMMEVSFESRDQRTLIATRKRGAPERFELQEPAYCEFRFTVEAGTRDAATTTADLSKLNRLEVVPTMSGNFGIVYLAGEPADAVSVKSRYGDQKSNKVRLNNLVPSQIDAFLTRVTEFQGRMCGVKVAPLGN